MDNYAYAPTILIIDDDMLVVQMLKAGLESAGYNTIIGFDGQMAIQLARTRKPNLIIMDINMPMTNGLKALASLRQTRETQDIPVIFLSGEPSGTVYPIIESVQRVSFIKKPLDLEHVLSLVRETVTSSSTRCESPTKSIPINSYRG